MCKEKQRIHENYSEALRLVRSGRSLAMPKSRFLGGFKKKKAA